MKKGLFICIIGVDGVGKSTHANLLVKKMQDMGVKTRYAHLRFFHIISLPLLLYARIKGYSKLITIENGEKMSYHFFKNSSLLRTLYPITQLIDISIGCFFKVYLPLRFGFLIICDRFIFDTIVDIMISTGDITFYTSKIASILSNLVPKNNLIINLSAAESVLRNRRIDVAHDLTLNKKVSYFHIISNHYNIPVIDTSDGIEVIHNKILSLLVRI